MAGPFNKPCLGCGVLIRGASYCDPCRPVRSRTPQNAAKKAFLYGGTYPARAKALRKTATHCHLCGQQFTEQDTIEADHLYPELGHQSPLAPAHRHCNQQRGNTPLAHRQENIIEKPHKPHTSPTQPLTPHPPGAYNPGGVKPYRRADLHPSD